MTRRLLPLLALFAVPTVAHDLEADRLTIVLRESNHVSLTFRVDEPLLMRRLLAPQGSEAEFMLPLAAMNDEVFNATVARFRSRFEQGLSLKDGAGRPILLRGWRWPDVGDLRRRLRLRVMQGIVGDAPHEHAPPVEITVDGLAVAALDRMELKLPDGLEDLVVVSYRPTQRDWHSRERTPLNVRF